MNPIIDGIKERMNNSVSGPFSLIYIIYNWKVVLYAMTGSETSTVRVTNIEGYYKDNLLRSFFCPILFLIVYLIIMPMIVAVIDYWNKRVEVKKLNKIEEYTLDESKLWTPVAGMINQIAAKADESFSYYESNRNNPGNSIERLRKCLNVLILKDREAIIREFKKLKLEGILK